MYKIIIKKFCEEDRELIANSYEEMRAVVTLCPESDYEIISVKKVNYDLASEFLEEINKEIVPKDLVYGMKEFEEKLKFFASADGNDKRVDLEFDNF